MIIRDAINPVLIPHKSFYLKPKFLRASWSSAVTLTGTDSVAQAHWDFSCTSQSSFFCFRSLQRIRELQFGTGLSAKLIEFSSASNFSQMGRILLREFTGRVTRLKRILSASFSDLNIILSSTVFALPSFNQRHTLLACLFFVFVLFSLTTKYRERPFQKELPS